MKSMVLVYLLLVHVVLAVALLKTDLVPRLINRVSGATIENTHLYDALLPYHRRMDGNVAEGSIIFLGDSIVQSLVTSAIADKTVNYGIGADTIGGLRKRLPFYRSLNNARAIVISIGVNDLWYRQHDEIILRYEQLLADLPDNVPVVANALFPIQEGLEYGDDTNARISHVNQSISEVASRFDNVLFINNTDSFVDTNGQLQSDYHIGDGLHLNTKAYEVWIERLRMAISQVTELQVD
jgi:lysophospholipase L1-like esterase